MNVFAVLLLFTVGLQEPVLPDTIGLDYCYTQAGEQYPVAQNIDLQQQITRLNSRIAHAGYYPSVQMSGKATMQSEVTEVPLPGGPPGVSKDQYEASLELQQQLFNGGAVGIRKELEKARGRNAVHATEQELHQLRGQIDQVYFGILLSQRQLQINTFLMNSLDEQLGQARSRVRNGAALPSQQHILEAEIIKTQQDSASIESNIAAGYDVLSELIGRDIPKGTPLSVPDIDSGYRSLQPDRPELALFNSSRELLQQQGELAGTRKLPSVSAFGRASYGRPGLNFLNDDFHDYYIGGVQLRWNFRDYRNADIEQQALKIEQQKVQQNEAAFRNQLRITLKRLDEEITTIKQNMERDRRLIGLRDSIVTESASQLKNGVITATEYVTQLNSASQARLSLAVNRVRLAKAEVEYLTALGQPLKSESTK